MNAILSEKGQITIPKALRDSLGLTSGMEIEFTEENGRLVGRKLLRSDPFSQWKGRGRLPHAESVDAYLQRIRDSE
jgi:AbrB family looped-hinge helix DNA binding protein